MNGPNMSNPIVNIPSATAPAVNGPVRIGREYTGKHRRDDGAGPLSPWRRPEPDTRPSAGTGPAPERGPWGDAR
jgi:hypothetical protein